MNMNTLLLEIERMKEIMGLDTISKPVLLESPGITKLYKLFLSADDVFSNVADNKTFIRQLDSIKPKGVRKLTAAQVDELAEGLAAEARAITLKMKTSGIDSIKTATVGFNAAKKFIELVDKTAKKDADALYTLYTQKQLNKIYDKVDSYWNKSYNTAAIEASNRLKPFMDAELMWPEDDIISSFKNFLEKEIKEADSSFKWADYPEFEIWAMKKFNDPDGTLDGIKKQYPRNITPSQNRYATFKSVTPSKLTADLDDVNIKMFTNLRALIGIKTKLMDYINSFFNPKTISYVSSLERNLELLKAFNINDAILEIGGKKVPSTEFIALVRNVSFDVEQIATLEKNTLTQWKNLMEEVKAVNPELVEKMLEIPIYKEVGAGWIWQEEKLNQFIERLELRFENVSRSAKKSQDYDSFINKAAIKEFFDTVKTTFTGIFNLIREIKGGVVKNGISFIKGLFSRRFWSAGLWGLPLTPKQIGLMITKRGLGIVPLIRSYLEMTVALKVWTFAYSAFMAVVVPSIKELCNIISEGCSEDTRNIKQAMVEGFNSSWKDFISVYGLVVPNIGEGFLWDFGAWLSEKWDNWSERKISDSGYELEQERNSSLKKLWDSLGEPTQERLLRGAEKAGGDFQQFSEVTNPVFAVQHLQFMQENGLSAEQVKKLRASRVMTYSTETSLGLNAKKLQELLSPEGKINIEKYLKVGAVKDKDGNIYTIKRIDDDSLKYEFFPPDMVTFFGVQPVGNNEFYRIYKEDKSGVKNLSYEELKKLGFHRGFDEKGLFTSKDLAEEVRDAIKSTFPPIPQKPISIQELIKRL